MKKVLASFIFIFIFTGIFAYSADNISQVMDEGIYQIQKGNYQKGREYLEDYLSSEENIEAYLYLIEAEKKMGNLNRADNLALKAVKNYPEDMRPLYERVLIRKKMAENEKNGWKKGKYTDEYYEMFEIYLAKINYEDSDKIFQLGDRYFRNGLYEKSRNIFMKEKNKDERNIFGAATTNRILGNYRKAVSLYGEILQMDPEFYEAYLGRGASYQQMGDYSRAIKDFKIYLEYKKDIDVYVALANIYISTERYSGAKEILEDANKNYKNSKAVRELLVEVYSKLER